MRGGPAGDEKPIATLPLKRFDIPAGPLDQALRLFEQASGIQIRLNLPSADVDGMNSKAISGLYRPVDALALLLTGTGLSSRTEPGNVISVGIRHAEQVDVSTSVASVNLQQFTQPLVDTAQTITAVPEFVLSDEAATTLRDGLRNVPGISMAAGEGGAQGDTLTIRGFNARNDIFLDGIRDFGSYYRDAFNYDAIDVLEGPAGVEFGRGATGGVVNQESKQPQLSEFVRGTAQFGTNEMRRITVDVNEPLKALGTGVAFRVNAVGTQTMVAERDVAEVRRFGIAPSVEFGLNTATRAEIQYLYESENTTPDYGLPYFGAALIQGAGRRTYYGFAADNYLRTNPDIVTGKIEHDLGVHATVRDLLRWANYPRDIRITEPQINTVPVLKYNGIGAAATAVCDPTIANTASTSACYPISTPVSQVQVKRNQLTSQSTEDMLWDQVSGEAHFAVAHVGNDAQVMVEGGRERSDPKRNGYTVPFVSATNPNPYDAFVPLAAFTNLRTHVASESFGVGFNDTVRLRAWLLVAGGVRFDYFSTQASNAVSGTATVPSYLSPTVERVDKQPTYRASVVVKPGNDGSLYFDWGTSFNPSAESLSLSGNNAVAAPEENETYELGAKWNFLRERLNLNASVFRTEKDNAHETSPNDSTTVDTVGSYLIRGFQVGALGHLPHRLDLVLGYAFLDSRLENSALNASPFTTIYQAMLKANDARAQLAPFYINPNGFPVANVPRNSGNVLLTHSLWRGFVGGFGANYTAARRASSGALVALPTMVGPVDVTTIRVAPKAIQGYWIFSAMLKRQITERLDFQINVDNLANKFYIDEPHPNHLVPGEGANAQFGFNYKW
ncbi:MAG TPA: TonB-dependent receptor [Acidobacteriaceae bacterium]|nr:TonB-dependent receptor [Acidobacteriaceae bacterium]